MRSKDWNRLVMLAAVLALGACTSGGEAERPAEAAEVAEPAESVESAEPEEAAEVAEPAVVDAAGQAQAALEITLLERGAEPHRELRYDFEGLGGQTATMQMDMRITMRQRFGEMEVPVPEMPVMRNRMRISDVSVEDGSLHATVTSGAYELLDVEQYDAELVTAIRSALPGEGAITGRSVMDQRGFTENLEFTYNVEEPSMQQMLEGFTDNLDVLAAPLPEEAVGVGARWRTERSFDSGGIMLTQTEEWELVELEGSSVTLRSSLRQTAEPQAVDVPDAPPGTEAWMVDFNGEGSGTVRFMLDTLEQSGEAEVRVVVQMAERRDAPPGERIVQEMGMNLTTNTETP